MTDLDFRDTSALHGARLLQAALDDLNPEAGNACDTGDVEELAHLHVALTKVRQQLATICTLVEQALVDVMPDKRDVWSLIYEAFLDAPQYQRPEAAPAEAEPEPEPEVGDVVELYLHEDERVLATDLKVGDTIRWEVQAERIDPADGRVYMATTAEFTGTVLHITDDGLDYLDVRIDAGDGEEVRPFIRRTALVQVVGRKAVA